MYFSIYIMDCIPRRTEMHSSSQNRVNDCQPKSIISLAENTTSRLHWKCDCVLVIVLSGHHGLRVKQGVTKICRLSWLNNSALVCEPKCGGGGCWISANEYSCAHGAHITNKLWRSSCIFDLWSTYSTQERTCDFYVYLLNFCACSFILVFFLFLYKNTNVGCYTLMKMTTHL